MALAILLRSEPDSGVSFIHESQDNAEINVLRFQTDYLPLSADINMENFLVAVGTCCGSIDLLRLSNDDTITCHNHKTLFQASSVTGLCLAGDSHLVSCNSQGEVFLWDINSTKNMPHKLEPMNYPVNALTQIGDGLVAGLSSSGKLAIWDIDKKRIVCDIGCPDPQSSLVQLHHWSVGKCLLYPSSDGTLVIYNLENNTLASINAHRHQPFSVTVSHDYIYTISLKESCMKRYSDILSGEYQTFTVPENITSINLFDDSKEQFVGIDSGGNADIYCVVENRLEPANLLKERCCHTVVIPHPNYRRVLIAAAIKGEIENNILSGQTQDLDYRYDRLKDLGFPVTALTLKISACRQNDDLIDYLSALKELVGSLPHNKGDFDEYIIEYTRVLQETWHPLEAINIYEQRNIDSTEIFKHLSRAVEIISNDIYVIEADIEIDKIIASASFMGKIFEGLWCIDQKPSLSFKNITAAMIAEKYNQIRKSNNTYACLSEAQVICPFWLTKDRIDNTELVIFSKSQDTPRAELIYGIKIDQYHSGSFLTPVMLFSAGVSNNETDFLAHNKNIESIYRSIMADTPDCRWPDMLFKTVRNAIQQANTSAGNMFPI
ncbi:MAG: hypothetical protein JXA96_13175 [Sedimentisphaerales bacterium]|nr:hypothetical protein [Sedimentisphaerales bacterium]